MSLEQPSQEYNALYCFIAFGNDLTRLEGSVAYTIIEDALDMFIAPESPEQTARCIGRSTLDLDIDKLL